MAGTKDRDIMMHELGHLKLRSRLGEKASKALNLSRAGMHLTPVGAIAGYHVAKNSDSKAGAITGAAMAVAPMASTLIDEGYATGSAVKHIAKSQGVKKGLQAAGKLAVPFGSYAGLAGVGAAAAHYGLKARAHRLAKKKAGG